MSADLLAEFDSNYTARQNNKPSSTPASNSRFSLQSTTNSLASGFGSTSLQWQTSQPKPADDSWGSFNTVQQTTKQQPPPAQAAPSAQDDIWGAFGDSAGSRQTSTFPAMPGVQSKIADPPPANSNNIRAGVLRRPTLELFSGMSNFDNLLSKAPIPNHTALQRPIPPRQSSSGAEILFDADEVEDDDEFGEFESVASPEPKAQAHPTQLNDFFGSIALEPKTSRKSNELLSTSIIASPLPYPQAPRSPSFQERNPFSDLKIKSPKDEVPPVLNDQTVPSATPVTAWPTFEPKVPKPSPYEDSPAPIAGVDEEDQWGEFADLPPQMPPKPSGGIEADAWAWDAADRVAEPSPPSNAGPPPTNIPPPSILLALFQPLFDLPQSTLFKSAANPPFALKNRILSDPLTIEFLRGYLLIAVVAARIIAGRKLRWKRDTILSQAMKIGPSAAGGKGGMKLTGVDKAEVTREDREAADVVRLWKEQLGRLKSAVAVANTSLKESSSHLLIPEINEVMHVKAQDGAMSTPKPCVVCGLKRDERIAKVDVQVEDSFGEWWTEHWGHRACRNFWQEHESKLKQR